MSFAFYTINPEPPLSPIAYVCRVFVEDGDSINSVETKSFPILSPKGHQSAYDSADLYGKLSVAVLIQEVQS